LIISTSSRGEADRPETQPTVLDGQPAAGHLANGPKEIPPGWEKIVFVHYRKPRGKPADKPGVKPPKPTDESDCYTFLANGARWKIPSASAFLVDTANKAGLSSEDIMTAVGKAAGTWAAKAGEDILPSCTAGSNLVPDEVNPDGDNEIVFGSLDESDAIAVTIVWGRFGGPPKDREIVEFDMIFDDEDFDWAVDGSSNAMDLENIATHELGHAVGLGDLYNTCTEATMYGYSTEGETTKRSLEAGDIAGLQVLYGTP
jgi:hypothetical protein